MRIRLNTFTAILRYIRYANKLLIIIIMLLILIFANYLKLLFAIIIQIMKTIYNII